MSSPVAAAASRRRLHAAAGRSATARVAPPRVQYERHSTAARRRRSRHTVDLYIHAGVKFWTIFDDYKDGDRLVCVYNGVYITAVKFHRQRIPKKIVIRRYLERSIQKFFSSNLHSLQIKTIFQEKNSICENLLSRYMWFISMAVTSIIGIGRLSAVLPIIGIGRLLRRYWPIISFTHLVSTRFVDFSSLTRFKYSIKLTDFSGCLTICVED